MAKKEEGTRKKKKSKSIKANVTSKFGSKRRLSRMGKKVSKGQMGPSTEYITRSSVLKRLQLSLKDFRRLCILKGIYPRVPTKAPKGADKVYYELKDISYLAHEPLLHKFREFKSFMKKIRKAAGRQELETARRKNDMKPKFVLNHLVKERYPRFIDALRDLDDALCMIHLFASLPSQGRITTGHTACCRELVQHWQYYVAKSQVLQKVFVSIKGVYFQAEILGEPITWLSPHRFTQAIPKEVDLRVMTVFLDFYEVFLKFVMYKLYHNMDLQYPPVVNKELDAVGCCLLAVEGVSMEDSSIRNGQSRNLVKLQELDSDNTKQVTVLSESKKQKLATSSKSRIESLEGTLKALDEGAEESDDEEDGNEVSIAGPLSDAFSGSAVADDHIERAVFSKGTTYSADGTEINRASDGDTKATLFQGLKFFINREVPLDWLQLVVLSAGGCVGWDGPKSPFDSDDLSITHHVIDRPLSPEQEKLVQQKRREFIQPQWVFDCLNNGKLLPASRYAAGTKLPPHLSPFVDDEKEGYTPKYRKEISGTSTSNGKTEEDDVANEDMDEDYESGLRAERSGDKGKSNEQAPEDLYSSNEDDDSESEKLDKKKALAVPLASSKGPKGVVFERKAPATTEVINYIVTHVPYVCVVVRLVLCVVVTLYALSFRRKGSHFLMHY